MNLEELGRRAVACPRWRWMPGMLLQWKPENGSRYRGRVCDTWSFEDEGALYCEGHEDRFTREELKAAWPDLSDPATLGCLLALVQEAYGPLARFNTGFSDMAAPERAHMVLVHTWTERHKIDDQKPVVFHGASLAECLVAALEAAP